MIYIRNIFKQDLRNGKQIAFTKEPSNLFFNFSYSSSDSDRLITFIFKNKESHSSFGKLNDTKIKTRLYSAPSESRIDGELKKFLRDSLNAKVEDLLLFRRITNTDYTFEFHPAGTPIHQSLKRIFKGNHEVITSEPIDSPINTAETTVSSNHNLKENFANWFIKFDGIKHKYYSDNFASNRDKFIEELTKYEEVYKEQFGTSIFSFPEKEIIEFMSTLKQNLYLNSGNFFDFSEKKSTHTPRAILGKKNYLKFIKEFVAKETRASKHSPLVAPINKIYFGAPGTGKSFQITEELKEVDEIFQKRITFHPEYDNSSFVGGYKPITDSSGAIRYEFVPQTFTKIYEQACNDSEHQYYLIIEEINRGNCAEIFGELFQLLDRNPKYKIEPSNELAIYLDDNITEHTYYKEGKMLLPENLSILATMNTSDQSLFPMDSAFKRRWDWEYIPINYDDIDNPSYKFEVQLSKEDSKLNFSWIKFIEKVNTIIKENPNLGMDKCIGNYFIKAKDDIISLEEFINKAIFYLWNDVFKDEEDHIFEKNTFYEDFFPIQKNGKEKILKILEHIDLEVLTKEG